MTTKRCNFALYWSVIDFELRFDPTTRDSPVKATPADDVAEYVSKGKLIQARRWLETLLQPFNNTTRRGSDDEMKLPLLLSRGMK